MGKLLDTETGGALQRPRETFGMGLAGRFPTDRAGEKQLSLKGKGNCRRTHCPAFMNPSVNLDESPRKAEDQSGTIESDRRA